MPLRETSGVTVALSPETVDAIADALAERLREPQTAPEHEWLAPQGAADYLGLTRRRIHDLTSLGAIKPDGRDGRTPLFRRRTLDRYACSEDE